MLGVHDDGTTLAVWVVPGSSRSEVAGAHGDMVKVRVSSPAEGGKANGAMLSVLSERLGAPCRLAAGGSHRRKAVVVEGLGPTDVADRLGIDPPDGAKGEDFR